MAPPPTREPQVKINRSPGYNPCFDEMLGDELRLRMMQIPGGNFMMGSPENEVDRLDSEGPEHRVSIETFFLGKYPVTQAQWRFVAGLRQVNIALEPEPSNFKKGDDHPVEQVSWHDSVEFCDRLSAHTGKQYQLPTEAQWEYACRANTTTPFHFGSTITTEVANYDGTDAEDGSWSGSYGNGPKGEYRKTTTPVDYFDLANAFGLCDMHGNVWEWCADHWHVNYENAPTDGSAWLTDDESSNRVRRGGSWYYFPRNCRSASRDDKSPGNRNYIIGFRVSCRAPRTLQPSAS
ncbi:MAG: formylglycine-generating enzyme family protein [Cyanobacteria bacterium J06632_3]